MGLGRRSVGGRGLEGDTSLAMTFCSRAACFESGAELAFELIGSCFTPINTQRRFRGQWNFLRILVNAAICAVRERFPW